LLVCAGVSAVKWQANKDPEQDWAGIQRLLGPLESVRAETVVLISTVDVYPASANGADESFDCHGITNHAYGTHRLAVEDRFRELFPRCRIVRLPALFGHGLKKNILFDLLNDNLLESINPSSSFQYYDMSRLWTDVERAGQLDLDLVNFFTEPIRTSAILKRFFPDKSVGAKPAPESHYAFRTMHAGILGGHNGFMFTGDQVLDQMAQWLTDRQGAGK
ncbi:MAG: NAD(P)-dependent oxidoreductase, partial [Bryobacteraceae bacterium]|nr:NAD(P)-dependent oxidoreductase [Bryobacteraceae bacterium]